MSNSKLKWSGGDRRVTRQMTANQLDSRNPLRIPELLENILGFLPVEDLKTCRLVNKFWKDTALKPMRKKCEFIRFGRRRGRSVHLGNEDMKRFLQCFSVGSGLLSEIRDDIPCTKFGIFINIIDEGSSDRKKSNKSIVVNFLQAISPWVTEIEIKVHWENNISRSLPKGMKLEELKFPSLKHTIFSNCIGRGDVDDQVPAFTPWMSIFITNAPQLEKLDFTTYGIVEQGKEEMVLRDPSLTLLLQILKHNQGLKIRDLRLHIAVGIEDSELIHLKESGLKLKSLTLLSVWNQSKSTDLLSQLLKSQSENLENLTTGFGGSVVADVAFPLMKNLTSFTIDGGRCPGLINYAEQMPSLERVVFHGSINENDWPKYLNEEMRPAPGVKEICFLQTRPIPQAIREAVRIFPNISKFELEVPFHSNSSPLPMVYDLLPNLEELTLVSLSETMRIDGLLTGLSEKGCRHALGRLRDWTPDFDDSNIQVGINHSPISVLKNLKVLRLRNHWPANLEIGIVSLCLALMKMSSLKILDLGERSKEPDESIPKSVLEEFRKNRHVLWKLKKSADYYVGCACKVCDMHL